MGEQNKNSDPVSEEARLLYQVSIKDIQYFKLRQWASICYGFLLLASIIAYYRLLQSDKLAISFTERIILVVIAISIPVVAGLVLRSLENSLEKCRTRLRATWDTFPSDFKQAMNKAENIDSYFSKWYHAKELLLLFIILLGLGAALIAWYFLRQLFLNGASPSIPSIPVSFQTVAVSQKSGFFGLPFWQNFVSDSLATLLGVFLGAWLGFKYALKQHRETSRRLKKEKQTQTLRLINEALKRNKEAIGEIRSGIKPDDPSHFSVTYQATDDISLSPTASLRYEGIDNIDINRELDGLYFDLRLLNHQLDLYSRHGLDLLSIPIPNERNKQRPNERGMRLYDLCNTIAKTGIIPLTEKILKQIEAITKMIAPMIQ